MRVLLAACGACINAGPTPGRWFPLGKPPATKDCRGNGQ
jgi:hypothetical protein